MSASVIYYASLLLGYLRCHAPLSPLNRGALLKGVRWALEQSWLDPETRTLFEEGQLRLSGANVAVAAGDQPRLQDD